MDQLSERDEINEKKMRWRWLKERKYCPHPKKYED